MPPLNKRVQYLGRKGRCVVDETEKGWYIQWIDRDPAAIARQEQLAQKIQSDQVRERERERESARARARERERERRFLPSTCLPPYHPLRVQCCIMCVVVMARK
jgi:hypothetical protein